MRFIDQNLDASESALGVVVPTLHHFPMENLLRLYMFDDGDIGSSYGDALDSSSHAINGTKVTGSAAIERSIGGIKVPTMSKGVLFDSAVSYGGKMSAVMAVKVETDFGATSAIPWFWGSSAMVGASLANSQSQFVTGPKYGSLNTTQPGAEDNFFFLTLYRTQAGAGAASQIYRTGTSRKAWQVFAWSFDPDTDTFCWGMSGGQSGTLTYADMGTAMESMGGNHVFGLAHHSTVDNAKGEVGPIALYSDVVGISPVGGGQLTGLDWINKLISFEVRVLADRGIVV